MENKVHFQFTKFVALDGQGGEKEVRFGYRVFDDYANYSEDTLTREQLMRITPQDALTVIEEAYVELYESILDKGFYFNQQWIGVDETGTILL